jgi:succinyl-diaminopimelate desuccinylase
MPEPLSAEQTQRIVQAAEELAHDAITFLQGMICLPTINPPGRFYPECAHFIGNLLSSLGYHVQYQELTQNEVAELAPYGEGMSRTNIIARLPGSQSKPLLHFNGHMDVVPVGSGWSTDPFGGEVRSGRIYGRGASDMKGGLAAQVYAVEAIRHAGLRLLGTVEQSAVVDEESTGNRNAGMGLLVEQGFIDREHTDYVVITEPLNVDNICLGHRGAIWGEITTFGSPSHGSTPERGINAVEHMAGFIQEASSRLKPRLQQRLNSYPVVPQSASSASLSFNMISGGTNVNSVPDQCTVAFDRRLVMDETLDDARHELRDILEDQVASVPGFRYEYRERYATNPTWVSAETPLVHAFQGAIQTVLGHEPGYVCSPGSDDQRFVVHNADIEQCIVYGPGEIIQTHNIDESLAISDLVAAIKVMALATANLLGVMEA